MVACAHREVCRAGMGHSPPGACQIVEVGLAASGSMCYGPPLQVLGRALLIACADASSETARPTTVTARETAMQYFTRNRSHDGKERRTSRVVLGILAAVSCVGCTQFRWNWRETMRISDGNTAVAIPSNSISGRVAHIRGARSARTGRLPVTLAAGLFREIGAELAPDRPYAVRLAAAQALGRIKSEAALAALQPGLIDSDPRIRSVACESVAENRSPQRLDALRKVLLEDDDTDVKVAAIRGLRRSQDPSVAPVLGQVLNDRDPAVQYAAMQALDAVTDLNLGMDVRRWRDAVARDGSMIATRPDGRDIR